MHSVGRLGKSLYIVIDLLIPLKLNWYIEQNVHFFNVISGLVLGD